MTRLALKMSLQVPPNNGISPGHKHRRLAELAQHVLDLEAAADEASTRIEALQAEITRHRAAKDRLAESQQHIAPAELRSAFGGGND